jgi:uncharacterized phiE125 gp8 family phage protein
MHDHTQQSFAARIVSGPAAEPISLEDARAHLRVTPYLGAPGALTHPDDPIIQALLSAAREHAENFTGLSIADKVYEQVGSAFPSGARALELLHPPLVALVSVTQGAVVLAPADVLVRDWTSPQAIYQSTDWPVADAITGAVRIRFRAGYAAYNALPGDLAQLLPFAIRAAILLTLGHLYENRENTTTENLKVLPLGVEVLLRPLRTRLGLA